MSSNCHILNVKKGNKDQQQYQSQNMEMETVMERLLTQGFRITRQRKLLIDIILGETCSCCKEIYVLALKRDPGIGIATVYRTMDALERIGALKRGTAYQLCDQGNGACRSCLVELDDNTILELDYESLEKIIESGMRHCGILDERSVKGIALK